MALSTDVLTALAKEHARLSAEQLRITQEMHEIEALLRRHGRNAGTTSKLQNTPLESSLRLKELQRPRSSSEETADVAGLRSTILKIMDHANRGYRPSEMTNALHFRGFQPTEASTPFATRVASEMARLYREGRLTKDSGDGRYRSTIHTNGGGEPSALDTLMDRQ
jgi:hypothetical protein